MLKEYIVTWTEDGQLRQKKVQASCLIEALGKSPCAPLVLLGCNYIEDVLEDQPVPKSYA